MSPIAPIEWCEVGQSFGNIPKSRHGHRAVSFNGKMIVFGGGNGTIQNKIHVYIPEMNMWLCPKMFGQGAPYSCASHGFTTDGLSRMFLFGGITASTKFTNDLYVIKSSYYVWKKIPLTQQEGPIPAPRMGHSFTYYDNRIYLFGGFKEGRDGANEFSNELYVLNVENDKFKWTMPKTSGSPPVARESHTANIFIPKHQESSPKLIIYGGMNGHRLGDVCILDIATMTWSKPRISFPKSIFVEPRSQHTACLFNDKMYVFGGWIPIEDDELNIKRSMRSNSLAILDLNKMAWVYGQFKNMHKIGFPQARTGHSAVILNSRLYIWSGRGDFPQIYKNQTCHNDLWYLELEKPKPPDKIELTSINRSMMEIKWASVCNADYYCVQIRDMKRNLNPRSPKAMKRLRFANSQSTDRNTIIRNFSDKSSSDEPVNETQKVKKQNPNDGTKAIREPSNQTLNKDTSVQNVSKPPEKVDDETKSTPKKVKFSFSPTHAVFKVEDPPKILGICTTKVVRGSNEKTPPSSDQFNSPVPLFRRHTDAEGKKQVAPPVLRSILKRRPEESRSETSSDIGWGAVGKFRNNKCMIKHYFVPNAHTDRQNLLGKHQMVQLKPNTEYQIRLCSFNRLGQGPWSDVFTARTCDDFHPLPPKNVHIINTESTLRLCWSSGENRRESSDYEQDNTEYIVTLAVREDNRDGEDDSNKNDDDDAAGTKTNKSKPSTPYSFALIYEGCAESIPLCESYLKQAYIDRTVASQPAILFRICARNSYGYSPTIQISWNFRGCLDKNTFSLKRPSPISIDVIKKLRINKKKPLSLKRKR